MIDQIPLPLGKIQEYLCSAGIRGARFHNLIASPLSGWSNPPERQQDFLEQGTGRPA